MLQTILIAEDDPTQRRMLRKLLEKDLPVEVVEAADGGETLKYLKDLTGKRIDLALIDLQMPVMSGMDVIRQASKANRKIPFIVITSSEDVSDAVEAMQYGAVDFITKPAQPERLVTSVKNALAIKDLQDEVTRLQSSTHYNFDDIVQVTPSLKNMISLGKKAASSDIPVLITGESGVGKEVFAHAIHQESRRKDKPFISVNCGALPDNLVESTLFGHEKGSFTGATNKSIGKCREADGGILFLDEVGELKLEAQVKLLRMLQQGEIEPVGSGKPVKVDVRIISATNRSLEQLVAQGKFREDLYYRLHGLPMHIPPLRERRNDIPTLSNYLLRNVGIKERRQNLQFSAEAANLLKNAPWTGNVRELQYVISRAVLLSDNDIIEASVLNNWTNAKTSGGPAATANNSAGVIEIEEANGQLKSLEQIEQEVIEAALSKFSGHVGKAAAALSIGQSTLYKRMKKSPMLAQYLANDAH